MMKTRTFLWVAAAMTTWACSSEDSLLSVDGGADVAPGTGGVIGKGGSGGSGIVGSGGAGTLATGGTQSAGSGGRVGTGGSAGGAGGVLGTGGSAPAGGTAGTTARDAGSEVARDAALDAADAAVECAPGYPVGSTKPVGDGCNTCTCMAGGYFACTTAACPASDASADACPSGQRWCPGCTPGTGACGVVCTGAPCPVPDADCVGDGCGASDAATDGHADGAAVDGGACSSLTTLADCQGRSDCHAVFTDPGTCGCATSGCCAHFSRCADGGKALCTQPTGIACAMPTPFCESPYVLSYTAVCYEGCVLSSECGP
jgi:hypothetical protein